MKHQEETNSICCPKFEPEKWDDKIIEWNNKKFIKDKVCTFFYMPMNFGKVMTRLNEKIAKIGANVPDWLCLCDHTSKWNMDVYLAVENAENIETTTMSGKFYSKVYEGNFKDTGKWMKDYKATLISKELKTNKMFTWYTTCPKCAKKYGKNYVVIISEILES